jgi:hypothetical protein
MVDFCPQVSVCAIVFLRVERFPIFLAIFGDKVIDIFRLDDLVVNNDICCSVSGQNGQGKYLKDLHRERVESTLFDMIVKKCVLLRKVLCFVERRVKNMFWEQQASKRSLVMVMGHFRYLLCQLTLNAIGK